MALPVNITNALPTAASPLPPNVSEALPDPDPIPITLSDALPSSPPVNVLDALPGQDALFLPVNILDALPISRAPVQHLPDIDNPDEAGGWGTVGPSKTAALYSNDGLTTYVQSGAGANVDMYIKMASLAAAPTSVTVFAWAERQGAGVWNTPVQLWVNSGVPPPFGGGPGGFVNGNFVPVTVANNSFELVMYTLTALEVGLITWTDKVYFGFRAGLLNTGVYAITQIYYEAT